MNLALGETETMWSADEETVVSAILRHAYASPDAPSIHLHVGDEVRTYTREQLVRESLKWTRAYQDRGLRSADIVIVMMEFGAPMLFAYLGAMLGGFLPSFMPYSTDKQDRDEFIQSHRRLFERTSAKIVATGSDWLTANRPIFDGSEVQPLLAEDVEGVAAPSLSDARVQCRPEDLALLQHSSGTTALKKGVALSHRAIMRQARSYGGRILLGEDDVIASWLPLYHDMGLMACFLIPLISGVPVAQMDPFRWAREPWRLFRMIERHRATLVWLPNFAYQHLARSVDPAESYDLSSVRGFIDCSEPCKPNTMRLFLDTFRGSGVRAEALQACYAMAENVFAVTQTPMGEPPRFLNADAHQLAASHRYAAAGPQRSAVELMSLGFPIEGVSVRVVDDARHDAPDGAVGEIAVSGQCLFSEYFRLPEETTAVLDFGWYYTGDLGFIWRNELYITGRKKDLIIVRGRNFYSHDIEYIVGRVDGIKPGRAVAFGVFREAVGTEDAIVVAETTDFGDVAVAEQRRRSVLIKQRVKEALDLDLHTVRLVPPGWLLKTTSGKINRTSNRSKFLAEAAGET